MAFDKYLKIHELREGVTYILKARNAKVGTWNGQAFLIARYKYKNVSPDYEEHWDVGPPFGTAKPLAELKINLEDYA